MLDREAHDWERLRREGFRLLPHGWRGRALALLNADHSLLPHRPGIVEPPITLQV
jgi:hypothetical protein